MFAFLLAEVESCYINQIDCAGNTPLAWAALNGHEEVVKILIGRGGVSPDKPDNCGQTPLHCGSKYGVRSSGETTTVKTEIKEPCAWRLG